MSVFEIDRSAPAAEKPRWITVAEFKERYRIGHTRAYELIKAEVITTVKIGSSTRIPLASAESWADGLERASTDRRQGGVL